MKVLSHFYDFLLEALLSTKLKQKLTFPKKMWLIKMWEPNFLILVLFNSYNKLLH